MWRDLRDLLERNLGLKCIEFNSSPAAGLTATERIDDMLDEADFAFLVMTAEDETKDGKKRARENVVHETGLFQGKLGRKKAIALLEETCGDYSNISSITQIRFPVGKIIAASEEIRGVLKREGMIP